MAALSRTGVRAMKRDMELFRSLLMAMEDSSSDSISPEGFAHKNKLSPEVVNYHVALLVDADFIHAFEGYRPDGTTYWTVVRVKHLGHEFLALARNDSI